MVSYLCVCLCYVCIRLLHRSYLYVAMQLRRKLPQGYNWTMARRSAGKVKKPRQDYHRPDGQGQGYQFADQHAECKTIIGQRAHAPTINWQGPRFVSLCYVFYSFATPFLLAVAMSMRRNLPQDHHWTMARISLGMVKETRQYDQWAERQWQCYQLAFQQAECKTINGQRAHATIINWQEPRFVNKTINGHRATG